MSASRQIIEYLIVKHDGIGGTWTCDPDPLARTWDTAKDAMHEMGDGLDWWEEDHDVWMAHRSEGVGHSPKVEVPK